MRPVYTKFRCDRNIMGGAAFFLLNIRVSAIKIEIDHYYCMGVHSEIHDRKKEISDV